MSRFLLFAMICLLPVTTLASPQMTLFKLVNDRLSLMQDVAAWKYRHHKAIEDLDREKVVLDKAAAAGLRVGLVEANSRVFFQAQIEAAKEIQRYWFAQYEDGVNPSQGDDLVTVIRPKLLKLGNDITKQLSVVPGGVSELWQAKFDTAINVPGLSAPTKMALFRALTEVQRYPDRLTQVLDTHILRVGTTGDYAPFTRQVDDGYEGIDIDMAQDLAHALGARVQFVPTTWPTLIDDLEAGKYDIAMGGVSRNAERQKVGYQSIAYYTGGKAAIVRCEDVSVYRNFAAVDKPGVRVIVNPGGTNQKFVEQHIEHARVIVYPDNRTIFNQIARGKADVMITDAIEVKLQSQQNKTLCPAMPGVKLTHLEKAYLMPRDEPLLQFVNTWLSQEIADGTVKARFDKYIGD